jgi:nucleolar pre-ribosomal-associated protein 1
LFTSFVFVPVGWLTIKPADIRTLYILFLLSFVQENSPSSLKTAFLEQRRDAFLSIFKGLAQDPYDVVHKVLEACWSGIWSDPKVTRTLKIGLFQEATIAHVRLFFSFTGSIIVLLRSLKMIKLYERDAPEGSDPDKVPADIVHHFLLSICTRPGTGICFTDRGWYPHESDHTDADEGEQNRGRKVYNKILSNIVKTLKVNEDPRQQELALKILAACPELVARFAVWSKISKILISSTGIGRRHR